jgi:hypothetical protein
MMDSQPVQLINPNPDFTIPLIDLQSIPATEQQTEIHRLATH